MKAANALRLFEEKQARAGAKVALERENAIQEGKKSLVRYVLDQVATGAKLTGIAGERISIEVNQLKEKFQSSMHISKGAPFEDEFGIELGKLVDRTSLRVHPEGHSMCAADSSPSENLKCKCIQLRQELTGEPISLSSGPDFRFTEDSSCASCAQSIRLPAFSVYWEEALSNVEDMLPYADTQQRELLTARAETIKGVLNG
jgi:hypothetical protein